MLANIVFSLNVVLMSVFPFMYYSDKWAKKVITLFLFIILCISVSAAGILEYKKIWMPHFILADVLMPFVCCLNIVIFGLRDIKIAFKKCTFQKNTEGKIIIDLSNSDHIWLLKEITPIILVCMLAITCLIFFYCCKIILFQKGL